MAVLEQATRTETGTSPACIRRTSWNFAGLEKMPQRQRKGLGRARALAGEARGRKELDSCRYMLWVKGRKLPVFFSYLARVSEAP